MQLTVIQQRIYEIKGQRVMMDYDLAELYQMETKRLKEAVRRNRKRFPEDFMFELTKRKTRRFEDAICVLKPGRTALRTFCLYRTRRGDAGICIKQ